MAIGSFLAGLLGGAAKGYQAEGERARALEQRNKDIQMQMSLDRIRDQGEWMSPEEMQTHIGILNKLSGGRNFDQLAAFGGHAYKAINDRLLQQATPQAPPPVAPQAAPIQSPTEIVQGIKAPQLPTPSLAPSAWTPPPSSASDIPKDILSLDPQGRKEAYQNMLETKKAMLMMKSKAEMEQQIREQDISRNLGAMQGRVPPEALQEAELEMRTGGKYTPAPVQKGVVGVVKNAQTGERRSASFMNDGTMLDANTHEPLGPEWVRTTLMDPTDRAEASAKGWDAHKLNVEAALGHKLSPQEELYERQQWTISNQAPGGLQFLTDANGRVVGVGSTRTGQLGGIGSVRSQGNPVALGGGAPNIPSPPGTAPAAAGTAPAGPKRSTAGAGGAKGKGGMGGFYKSAMPTGEKDTRSMILSLGDDLDRVVDMANRHPDAIGRVAGNWEKAKAWMGYGDPEVDDLITTANNMKQTLLYLRSGKQINNAEYSRLSSVLADIGQPGPRFSNNIARFKRYLQIMADVRDMGRTASDAELDGSISGRGPSKAAPAAGGIMREKSKSGKPIISRDGGKTWEYE